MSQAKSSDAVLEEVRAMVKAASSWGWTSHQFQRDLNRILRTRAPRPCPPSVHDIDRLAAAMQEIMDVDGSPSFADVDDERRESLRYFAGLALNALRSAS